MLVKIIIIFVIFIWQLFKHKCETNVTVMYVDLVVLELYVWWIRYNKVVDYTIPNFVGQSYLTADSAAEPTLNI